MTDTPPDRLSVDPRSPFYGNLLQGWADEGSFPLLYGRAAIEAGPPADARVLVGLRGDAWDWDWESALLYSDASSEDKENRISNTRFQEALSWSTPDAYNPFNGGCPADLTVGECTPSSQVAIDYITVQSVRENRTSLASWDFKISRPDLFTNWAGDVGVAIGVEARRETYVDDRDPRQDGTIMFTDRISGLTTNDLMGNNVWATSFAGPVESWEWMQAQMDAVHKAYMSRPALPQYQAAKEAWLKEHPAK